MQQAYESLSWKKDHLLILDQTQLPKHELYQPLYSPGQVWDAIKKLKVRGAPAIGIAGAYGLYLAVKDIDSRDFPHFEQELDTWIKYLNSSRPTAVNLSWSLDRIRKTVYANKEKPLPEIKEIILKTAKIIHDEDKRVCQKIGLNGQELIKSNSNILTHCNTGGLATGAFGTAVSVILHAHDAQKDIHVWVDETRPLLQGARLTTWELQKAGVPFHLITDSMAGSLMNAGKVDMVIVGADRVTANGDAANKIGTYSLAVLAKAHGIPFYVALPLSTFDVKTQTGDDIVIEQRDPKEITHIINNRIAPKNIEVYNPAFDVTPHHLITAFITEKGIIKPNFQENIAGLFR